jgi:hypothetical protein
MFAGLRQVIFGLAIVAVALAASASAPDWSRDFVVPENGRANPYEIPAAELLPTIREGKLHALHYPVDVTGTLIPLVGVRDIRSIGERWLGLQPYPKQEGSGVYFVPFKNNRRPIDRMGFTVIETKLGAGVTISCAQCHTGNLFGRKVIGMTNRFPRANRAFIFGKMATKPVLPEVFKVVTGASAGETELYARSREALQFIGSIEPLQLGLDTSLAHVALSLARRAQDDWASKVTGLKARPEPLATFHADSKPAVWWNLKYKNRWLSDGSVVSGNPIYTNILWNEIGRGTDLHELDHWLSSNDQVIRELTTAVFSSEAPRFTDFFPAEKIDLAKAKHGQKLFNESCAKCHGTYEKAWDLSTASQLSLQAQLRTLRVSYQPKKPVFDVGTDPQRYQGMASLAQLNNLEISRRNGIVIEPQKGYVPPPLVGIWARWPYFHNNSAPSLCAVLTRHEERPVTYWAREANDPKKDFDLNCNGYPIERPTTVTNQWFYDTRRAGMHNTGHDERILLKDGKEIFSTDDKQALVQFLQTL